MEEGSVMSDAAERLRRDREPSYEWLLAYYEANEDFASKLGSAMDIFENHFDENGKLLGTGKWRHDELGKALVWIREATNGFVSRMSNTYLAEHAADDEDEAMQLQVINERDAAQNAADELASLVLGEPIDWTFHDDAWARAISKLKDRQ